MERSSAAAMRNRSSAIRSVALKQISSVRLPSSATGKRAVSVADLLPVSAQRSIGNDFDLALTADRNIVVGDPFANAGRFDVQRPGYRGCGSEVLQNLFGGHALDIRRAV
jgi:hypothetical protein